MAGEKLGYIYSAYAGEDLVGKEYLLVRITGAKNGLPVVKLATDAESVSGVILRGDVQDATVRICNQGIAMVEAYGNITAGGPVEAKDAKAMAVSSGIPAGIALQTATAGDIIPFMFTAQGPAGSAGAKGEDGDDGKDGVFGISESGATADRDQYDTEDPGFTFYDETTDTLYIMLPGGWSEGIAKA